MTGYFARLAGRTGIGAVATPQDATPALAVEDAVTIHELGHVLGFAHEWLHPATPAGCASVTPSGERPIAPGDPDYTITEAGFDFESLMTYNHGDNEECAAVTGVRFGSPNLSLGDRVGAQLVYPVLEDDPQGDDAVGVIPDRAGTCPATTEVVIYLDNENDGNANARALRPGGPRQGINRHERRELRH